MKARIVPVALALILLGTLFVAPASADPTCTAYRNIVGSKWRACIDPDRAPDCPAWSESYSWAGYMKVCYGVPRDSGLDRIADAIEPDVSASCTSWFGSSYSQTRYCVDARGAPDCAVYYERRTTETFERKCYGL